MNSDEQQICQLAAEWMDATRAGNIERVLNMMTEDVVFLTPGRSPMNKAQFAEALRSQASTGMKIDGRSEIREVRASDDWAFMWSQLSVTMTLDQGEPIERTGHTLTVFRKDAGRWLLARDANLLGAVNK